MKKGIIAAGLLVVLFGGMFAAPKIIEHNRNELHESASESLDATNRAKAASDRAYAIAAGTDETVKLLKQAERTSDFAERKLLIMKAADREGVDVKTVNEKKLEKLREEYSEIEASGATDIDSLERMLELSLMIAYNE